MNKSKRKANGMLKTRKELTQALVKLSNKKKKVQSNKIKITKKNIPVVKSYKSNNPAPKTIGNKDGSITVVHTEYIGDLTTVGTINDTNGYNISQFSVNPGLRGPFPWLSTIAQNYETFSFNQFEFLFIPNNTVIQKGSLFVVADFDSADSRPENKLDFLNMKGAQSSNVYTMFTYTPQHKDFNNRKVYNIRTGSIPSGTDIRLYDPFNLFVAYQGTNGGTILGEYRIRYSVTLKIPTMTLGTNQVQKIESFYSDSIYLFGNYRGEKNPFGDRFLSRIVGTFYENGLSWRLVEDTGLGAVLLIYSNKVVSKVFEFITALAAESIVKFSTRILAYSPPSVLDNVGVKSFGEVDENPMVTYSDLSGQNLEENGFSDVTETYAKTWFNICYSWTEGGITFYRRHMNVGLSFGPNSIIELRLGSRFSDVDMTGTFAMVTDSRVEAGIQLLINDNH